MHPISLCLTLRVIWAWGLLVNESVAVENLRGKSWTSEGLDFPFDLGSLHGCSVSPVKEVLRCLLSRCGHIGQDAHNVTQGVDDRGPAAAFVYIDIVEEIAFSERPVHKEGPGAA